MARRPPAPAPGTRSRILTTAAEEFGARGFAATTVDRIARRARVNKAMIYYHFPSKRALYTSIVREHFTPIVEKLAAITMQPAPPDQQLNLLIKTLVEAIDASKPFLPIFLREIADGAVHLGSEELALLAGIFGTVRSVIADGTGQNVFQPIHPALAHFTIIAPVIMFRATAPVRARIEATRGIVIPDADPSTVVKHMQMVARRMLARE
ncbi:MAG TPA: TetR/AcrR family transcriptional regulator [Vicinamibacterales bacterium]|jgi:TetR/AcrR family transcriptional regulator